VEVGVRRQRLVLAVLLLEVNKLVPADRLITSMWPSGGPSGARAVLHNQVSGVRAMLAAARPTGTTCRWSATGRVTCCDATRSGSTCTGSARCAGEARRHVDDECRVVLFTRALDLWRGSALAGVADDDVRERLSRHLDEARLAALEDRFDAQLRLGRHRAVVDELEEPAADYPHRQHLVGLLMRALDRCGRTGEALRVYHSLYRRLDDELGILPSPELQHLQLDLLRRSVAVP
jgi:DNA-binding SARP family transcriptional activator